MGTAAGHFLPGLLLLGIGFWHLICGARNYIRHPREYSARAWHPVGALSGRLSHLEIYLLVLILPLAVLFQLTVSTHFQPIEDGMIPSNRVSSFQHATVLLMFWVWAVISLVADTTALLPLPTGATFLLAAVAFAMEVLVLGSEVAQMYGKELQVTGLESKCYSLLAYVSMVCAASSLLLAWNPKAFLADLILSAAVLLQGAWSFQIGLSLYVDAFIPAGCARLAHLPSGVDASTQCDLLDSVVRAMALMDLAFATHVVAVVLVTVTAYGLVARLQGERRGYEAVASDSDLQEQVQMKPLPKLAQF